jgi:hypothetical protein
MGKARRLAVGLLELATPLVCQPPPGLPSFLRYASELNAFPAGAFVGVMLVILLVAWLLDRHSPSK